jgi:hypothetical protein
MFYHNTLELKSCKQSRAMNDNFCNLEQPELISKYVDAVGTGKVINFVLHEMASVHGTD